MKRKNNPKILSYKDVIKVIQPTINFQIHLIHHIQIQIVAHEPAHPRYLDRLDRMNRTAILRIGFLREIINVFLIFTYASAHRTSILLDSPFIKFISMKDMSAVRNPPPSF